MLPPADDLGNPTARSQPDYFLTPRHSTIAQVKSDGYRPGSPMVNKLVITCTIRLWVAGPLERLLIATGGKLMYQNRTAWEMSFLPPAFEPWLNSRNKLLIVSALAKKCDKLVGG
jgi:hypothetical protein